MPEDAEGQESRSVVERKIEAYAYSSDLIPHDSIIAGYEKAIPNGGKEVITIVKRQQLFTFIANLAVLFSNNLIPFVLILPVLLSISSGAVIEITFVSAVPIGLFTAGGAADRIITTWRSGGAQEQARLTSTFSPSGQNELPPETEGPQS